MTSAVERCYWTERAEPFRGGIDQGDDAVEVAVVGAGVTGSSAAYHLAAEHQVEVTLLDSEEPGAGASGRSAGMVVPSVGKLSIGQRSRRWGSEATRASGQLGLDAVREVADLIEAEKLDCERSDGGWVQLAHTPSASAGLADTAQAYRSALGYSDARLLGREELATRGYARGERWLRGVLVPQAFGINPLRYTRGFAKAACRRGARAWTHCPVLGWNKAAGEHQLATPYGTLRAKRVVLAVDAYGQGPAATKLSASQLLIQGAVIVTERLSKGLWDAVGIGGGQVYTDTRKVLFYWRRLPDDRLLFGGRGPAFGRWPTKAHHRRWLLARMAEKFPPLAQVDVPYFWTGRIALAYDLVPHLARPESDASIAYAACYAGTGIALATHWGRDLAALVLGGRLSGLSMVGTAPPRLPLPPLRPLYFNLSRLALEARDGWARWPR